MNYRERLYRDYSANFGEGKSFAPALQFRQFEVCYGHLLPPTGSMVGDLGCGKGEWLEWLRRRGFGNLWGVDRSPGDVAIARTHSPAIEIVEAGIVGALREERERFDLLHAKDVIEHLKPDELIEFLDSCHAALKPGGQLWLLTYNAQSPFANATRYGDFTHEIGLTPSSMAQVLSAAGFRIGSITGIHVCAATIPGRLRRAVWAAATPFFRLLLKARHGCGVPRRGVDLLATNPDLFAIARKAHEESSREAVRMSAFSAIKTSP